MPPAPKIGYVSADAPPLYPQATGGDSTMQLLWGDRVQVLEEGGERVKVRARGRENIGWVEKEALTNGKPLLELYVIDVGQGDGILIKTPNGRHLMIDGGLRRSNQPTGKSAADFVDWKFYDDYGEDRISIDMLIASHCDADHYGGLTDLLKVDKDDELDCEEVCVEQIYHAGLGWWRDGEAKTLGPLERVGDERFFTQLVGDREAIEDTLGPKADPSPGGEWRDFLRAAVGARRADGSPTPIRRLSSADPYLPGFEPGTPGEPAIKVLAPVHRELGGGPVLPRYPGKDSISTNGNSIVLSLDFDPCRILLTGDLNSASQKLLLADYEGRHEEFACDVGKACHHGSEDVSFAFLEAMRPAVTVFSSGDNEDYDHPRPTILAASAISGFPQFDSGDLLTPLVYSTELVRHIKIEPGNPSTVTGLVYGLVNVRTDGKRILCATRDEKSAKWHVAKIDSRF